MDIDVGKVHAQGCKVEKIVDGSVRLIKTFLPPNIAKQDLMSLSKYSYGRENEYLIRVNLPPAEKVDTVIIVSRTSVNCWRLIYSSLKLVEIMTYKTLTEVNFELDKLLKV